MWLDDQPTALYRFFDSAGALLYVGITANVEQRWTGHRYCTPWWAEVDRKTVEWHDTRPIALAAELAAIRAEHPRYNVAGSPWAPRPRELGEDEITVGQGKELLRQLGRGTQMTHPAFVVDRSRKRKRIAVVVPPEFYARAVAALGEELVPVRG